MHERIANVAHPFHALKEDFPVERRSKPFPVLPLCMIRMISPSDRSSICCMDFEESVITDLISSAMNVPRRVHSRSMDLRCGSVRSEPGTVFTFDMASRTKVGVRNWVARPIDPN